MLCLENTEVMQYEILEMIYPIPAAMRYEVHFLKINNCRVQHL